MSKSKKITITIFSLLLMFTSLISVSSNIQDVEVGFSPGKTAVQIILTALEEAKISIDIAAYSLTSKPIALAIVSAQHRGVNVRVVADKKSNNGKYTAVTYLANNHVPVKLNDKYAIMHNKFMIIDSNSIETGSFNYTQSAALRNAENVIYIRNCPYITKKYQQEFNRLWNEAMDTKSVY